jgi:hypothetical protein
MAVESEQTLNVREADDARYEFLRAELDGLAPPILL